MAQNNLNPIIRIKGEHINLCIARTDEFAVEKYLKWMNDEEIAMWIDRNSEICTRYSEEEWVKRDHPGLFNITTKDGELIGNCSISERKARNYVLGICIGEEIGRDKGFGTEVIRLLIKFCFEEKNAHAVRLCLNGDNKRALRCYEKAGMHITGVDHESIFYNGHWADTIRMEILETDYFNTRS